MCLPIFTERLGDSEYHAKHNKLKLIARTILKFEFKQINNNEIKAMITNFEQFEISITFLFEAAS